MTFHHERRLHRALHHLENLETELEAWREEQPYRTWSETDVDSTKRVLWVQVIKPPPVAELSLIIGDCIHNLRSALDNLAFELALAYKGGPLPSSIEGSSAFPTLLTEDPTKLNNMLKGIHPNAKAIIERLQPYNRWKRATNDPLWQLNKLDVEDKHRSPHITLFATVGISYRVSALFAVNEVEPMFGSVEDRAPVARYPAVDETGGKVNVYLAPTFSVAFGDRAPKQLRNMPVTDRLTHIHRYIVTKVVEPLAPYLT